MSLQFHPEALEEFQDAAHWYEDKSSAAGLHFHAEVSLATQRILADPCGYPQGHDGTRVFRLKRFPFRIYYLHNPADDSVSIYAVMHEKRRPDYWRKRLSP